MEMNFRFNEKHSKFCVTSSKRYIATKISEVSPNANGFRRSSEVFRKLPKLTRRFWTITRRFLKVSEDFRKSLAEDYSKASEDFRNLPNIAEDGLKIFERY